MMSDELYVNLEWLPRVPDDFNEQLQTATQEKTSGSLLRKLAGYALHINQIHRIAKVIAIAQKGNKDLRPLKPFSLGVVSNATTSIIVPALVATAARYGFSLTVHEAPYGQAVQVALGEVEAFKDVVMDAILIAIDYKGLPIQSNTPPFGKDADAVNESLDYLNTAPNLNRSMVHPASCKHVSMSQRVLWATLTSKSTIRLASSSIYLTQLW